MRGHSQRRHKHITSQRFSWPEIPCTTQEILPVCHKVPRAIGNLKVWAKPLHAMPEMLSYPLVLRERLKPPQPPSWGYGFWLDCSSWQDLSVMLLISINHLLVSTGKQWETLGYIIPKSKLSINNTTMPMPLGNECSQETVPTDLHWHWGENPEKWCLLILRATHLSVNCLFS